MKLKITFIALPVANDTITLSYDVAGVEFVRGNVFKTVRAYPGEVTIGANVNVQALNYYTAFVADYGSAFTVTVVGNVVSIEAVNGSAIYNYSASGPFVNFVSAAGNVSGNVIHIIRFTPRRYVVPAALQHNYLITEASELLTTESGDKIRL